MNAESKFDRITRFLADMGVSMHVVDWLRSKGHDVLHLRDEGLQRLPNGKIFWKAKREDRVDAASQGSQTRWS